MPPFATLPTPARAAGRASGAGQDRGLLLRHLVQQLPAAQVEGPLDQPIQGITHDSRRVRPGMVFVAIPGQQPEGHELIGSALDRGAAAVICDRQRLVPPRATRIRVPDVREAMACAARYYYRQPADHLKMVGITGTRGRTTLAFLLKAILEEAGMGTGLLSSLRLECGDRVLPAGGPAPESTEIQQSLAEMLRANCSACVLEIDPRFLQPPHLLGVGFDVAIAVNLTRDGMEAPGTPGDATVARERWEAALGRGAKLGGTVLRIDDDFGAHLAGTTKVEVELNFGLRQSARLRATRIELGPGGSRFVVEAPGRRFAVRLPLAGRSHLRHALAAVGVGLALEVAPARIQRALLRLPAVPGRLERVEAGQPFGVFVDGARTEAALAAALHDLRELATGRILLVLGDEAGTSPARRARLGRVAGELADITVFTTDNPRHEDPSGIVAHLVDGLRGVPGAAHAVELDRARAIARALGLARAGDVVLVAGKGHAARQEIEGTIVPFDDRAEAVAALAGLGFAPARAC
ncbi:MAG: UDP-N-acetylmuramoyl-L-alanyl-D-glutamate--2,6-diaminopimelate ligase [Verrucomicrobiota bacterium]|jgi:UDP-N-acetylmuramyl-tripeptide synthetase